MPFTKRCMFLEKCCILQFILMLSSRKMYSIKQLVGISYMACGGSLSTVLSITIWFPHLVSLLYSEQLTEVLCPTDVLTTLYSSTIQFNFLKSCNRKSIPVQEVKFHQFQFPFRELKTVHNQKGVYQCVLRNNYAYRCINMQWVGVFGLLGHRFVITVYNCVCVLLPHNYEDDYTFLNQCKKS